MRCDYFCIMIVMTFFFLLVINWPIKKTASGIVIITIKTRFVPIQNNTPGYNDTRRLQSLSKSVKKISLTLNFRNTWQVLRINSIMYSYHVIPRTLIASWVTYIHTCKWLHTYIQKNYVLHTKNIYKITYKGSIYHFFTSKYKYCITTATYLIPLLLPAFTAFYFIL